MRAPLLPSAVSLNLARLVLKHQLSIAHFSSYASHRLCNGSATRAMFDLHTHLSGQKAAGSVKLHSKEQVQPPSANFAPHYSSCSPFILTLLLVWYIRRQVPAIRGPDQRGQCGRPPVNKSQEGCAGCTWLYSVQQLLMQAIIASS